MLSCYLFRHIFSAADWEASVGTYREFVVFDASQIYPEYVILYEREFWNQNWEFYAELHIWKVFSKEFFTKKLFEVKSWPWGESLLDVFFWKQNPELPARESEKLVLLRAGDGSLKPGGLKIFGSMMDFLDFLWENFWTDVVTMTQQHNGTGKNLASQNPGHVVEPTVKM